MKLVEFVCRSSCPLPSAVRASGELMAYGQPPTPHSSPSPLLPCLHRFGGAPPHGMARDCCVLLLLQRTGATEKSTRTLQKKQSGRPVILHLPARVPAEIC
ncbi:hypothetical protein FQA47_018775 [Oryzias melastigma]|uniref:Uncharacterized protein n=1 Tax=Oryzias melastigma TaxID=30732 RepID=A0A834C1J8_ORYME|nr:hypothetical protein FQA47_018775 [Oryzias melastigma]